MHTLVNHSRTLKVKICTSLAPCKARLHHRGRSMHTFILCRCEFTQSAGQEQNCIPGEYFECNYIIYISWELEGAIKLTLHLFSQLLLYSTGVQWYKFGRPSNPVPKNRTRLALANSFQSGIHNFCCTCLDMDLGVCWLPQNAAFHLLYIGHLIQQDHSDLGREVHCRRNGVMET